MDTIFQIIRILSRCSEQWKISVFGGPAWEWVPELGQYYFHQFSVKQPDLNWENPKVRRELYDMILWWMEKGAGGFRLDVIDQIAKEPDLSVMLFVLFCIGFSKFTFSDSGNSAKKNMTVFLKHGI